MRYDFDDLLPDVYMHTVTSPHMFKSRMVNFLFGFVSLFGHQFFTMGRAWSRAARPLRETWWCLGVAIPSCSISGMVKVGKPGI